MNKIISTTTSFGKESSSVLDLIEKSNLELIRNPFNKKLTETEVLQLLLEHKPVGLLAGTEPITKAVLEKSQGLTVISRVGVGWDNVDRVSAAELGIKVFRTPGVLNQAVSELTLGMVLNALRSITLLNNEIRNGIWNKRMGSLLQGKKIGLVGFGDIGKAVGKLMHFFETDIVYYDPYPSEVEWARPVQIDELLRISDVISIHASGEQMIFGEDEIAATKKGVILINTARGGLIDEDVIYRFLENGHVAFACLDVFENEPYKGRLKELDNVILTPHIGSYARESRIRMEEVAVQNLITALKEEE